jgi:type I pantothenate kinase
MFENGADLAGWRTFTPAQWTSGAAGPQARSPDRVDMAAVTERLAELLQLRRAAWLKTRAALGALFSRPWPPRAYVVAVSGSVASGKSRFAQELRLSWERLGEAPAAIVPGDSFLLPNSELTDRGLMSRKGFPESFDQAALARFREAVLEGRPMIETPVYSHEQYDIVAGEIRRIECPGLLIFEGVNALQTPPGAARLHDFGIYLEASEADLERWYAERFLALRRHEAPALAARLQAMSEAGPAGPRDLASTVWREINLPNLLQHIAPSRAAADLVIEKAGEHRVERVRLRA